MRMRWFPEQLDKLVEMYNTHSAREIGAVLGCTKSAVKNRAQKLGLKKDSNGGCYKPGHSTWNKGIPFNSGGRSAETQFKPGHKPHTWNPVGHERITSEGILQRKMTDTGVTRYDYRPVHVMLWESIHGPIPRGSLVVFINYDRTDIRIDNLECLTRRENMLRNSVHTKYPPELAQMVQLRGAITRQINKRNKA